MKVMDDNFSMYFVRMEFSIEHNIPWCVFLFKSLLLIKINIRFLRFTETLLHFFF